MAKFSDIVAGTRAFSELETIEIAPGVKIAVRFRVLSPIESVKVMSAALADAKADGVLDPEVGDPIYEAAFKTHTLAFGIVDPESLPNEPQPYFDLGVDQIRASKILTLDVIAFLFTLWEHWADSVSLVKATMDEQTYNRVFEGFLGGDLRPFFELRPSFRVNFTRTTVARHKALLVSRSSSFSGSQETNPQNKPD